MEEKIINVTVSPIRYSQSCLFCENSRTLPEGMSYCHVPYICDECKEAMAFLKELKRKQETFDPLKPILD